MYLFWIPLGAGATVVRTSGRLYEGLVARLAHRPPQALYHSALVVTIDGQSVGVEMAPVPDADGAQRGVVAEGPVGSKLIGRVRLFRYEIRRWPSGVIPDLPFAEASPIRLTDERARAQNVLDLVASVPTPVWGRDELDTGEMWNSNSVVSWVAVRAGLIDAAGTPPADGRAPGWDAGVTVARRHT
ncbi:MAG: hypothetical protein JJU45_09195 [Acidimicrobiia bacterium]|nr:hypothetical protein [Acidimicrobiia bacterium]